MASLLVVRLFDEWFTFLPAGSIEPIRADLDLTYRQIAVLLMLLPAGGLVGGLFSMAADRVSRRAQASLGALGCALALGCWAVGGSLWVLSAGAFLLGMSSDAVISACEVALVDLAGDDLVATLAPATIAAEVGDLSGPLLLAGASALGWSWRAPFAIGALIYLAYAIVLAAQPLPRPHRHPESPTARSDVRSCLRDPRVWSLAAISLLFDTLDEPFLGFAIAYLEEERGQSHGLALMVGVSVIVGGILGAAVLTVRPPRARAGPPAGGPVLLALAVLGIIVAPGIPVQVAAGLVAGGASAAFWTRVQAQILGLRPGQAGTTGAVVAYLALPGALVPLVAAAVADRYGLGAALGVYLAIAVALAVVTAASTRLVPAPSWSPSPEVEAAAVSDRA